MLEKCSNMRAVVILCVCVCGVVGQDINAMKNMPKYDSRYDYLDVDAILDSKRLVRNYVDCLIAIKPCTPEGKALKRILPEALRTKCVRCTERQKKTAVKVIKRLKNEYPSEWAKLSSRWDPTGDFTRFFEEFLAKETFNTISGTGNEIPDTVTPRAPPQTPTPGLPEPTTLISGEQPPVDISTSPRPVVLNRNHQERIRLRGLRDASNPFALQEAKFKKLFRLPIASAQYLCELLDDFPQLNESGYIPKHLKILAALHFYADGSYQTPDGEDSLLSLSQPSMSRALEETTNAIVDILAPQYIKFPITLEEKQKTMREFGDDGEPMMGSPSSNPQSPPQPAMVPTPRPSESPTYATMRPGMQPRPTQMSWPTRFPIRHDLDNSMPPPYSTAITLIDQIGYKIIRTTELVTDILRNTVRAVVGR